MSEEYIIARLMNMCHISYEHAQVLMLDLERRNLLDHLKFNIDRYEDYIDIYDTYLKNYITQESER